MSGGLTYSPTDGFGWSWEGAAQGFAMGTLIGMVSGGMSTHLSGVGSSAVMTKVAQSTYTTKQVLLNMVLNGTLSALKETTSEKFEVANVLLSGIFGNISSYFNVKQNDLLINIGFSLVENLFEFVVWYIKSLKF